MTTHAIDTLNDLVATGHQLPQGIVAATQALAKPALVGWFVGQALKASGGKANPQAVNALVRARLGIE